MKQINLLFVLILSLLGVNQGVAQDAVTENFNGNLPEGWVLKGSLTHDDTRAKSGKAIWTSQKLEKTDYLVTSKLKGGSTITFQARTYNTRSYGYIAIYAVDSNGDITGNKLGEIRTPNASSSSGLSWNEYSLTVPTGNQAVALDFYYACLDDMTYIPAPDVTGPSLSVYGDNEGTLAFGMVNPGDTKQLVLNNPGTESITVDITTTGGFTTDASKTIAAGSDETIAIAAPSTTATGTVTFTPNPAVSGINPITINLSCTVKDPNKMFVDFSDNALPNNWEEYTGSTSYAWSYADGYAKNTGGTYYEKYLATPAMIFEDGETLMFDAAGNNAWEPDYGSSYAGSVTVKTSTDGTTFTDLKTFSGLKYETWQSFSVVIPTGTKYVRFYVDKYANIDNIYGGQYDDTPLPKLEVVDIANGESLSWGFADVPAGSTKTITLKNDGTADLNVTIAATDDYTVDLASATVEANGGTVVVTIGSPAHDGNGVLTITPEEGSGLNPYTINLTSYYKAPVAIMGLDKTAVAFGKVNEVKSETITVSNTGDGELVATITNDNTTHFTVSEESLTVAPGETATFTITYNFVEGTWGTFNANVKVTPNYGSQYDAKTIIVSATSKNPNVWSEDFEDGIPATWTNDGWVVGRKWNEESNVNHATTTGNGYLITPRLGASEGEELTFDFISNFATLIVEWSNSLDGEWTAVGSYEETQTITFTAPTDGNYYLRFSGSGSYLDNFEGFQLDLLAADAIITDAKLGDQGNQYVAYNAYVTVENKGTDAQTVIARLLINGEEKDNKEAELAVDGTTRIDLTFTPEEAFENGTAVIEVSLKGVEFVPKTVESELTITAAPVLDEEQDNTFSEGTLPAAVLRYKVKSGWNSIGVPFALTADYLTAIFGEGWKAYELKSYDGNQIGFNETTSFVAGYPYVIYIETAPANNDVILQNVNITSATAKNDTKNGLVFTSTYTPMAAGDMTGKYGLTTEGHIQKGSETATLKALHAYFYKEEGAPEADLANARVVFQNEDGTVTSIQNINALKAEYGDIYDISGRKVHNKNLKGIYIQNGKKVVVK